MAGAAAIFGIASITELSQKVGFYSGTFDFPGDFIAFGVGVGLAVTLDAITFRKMKNSAPN